MDRRVPLDHSADHRPAHHGVRHNSFARQSFAHSGVVRTVRRWFTTLIELDIPRGLGSSSAALLLLGSVCYGVVKGEHGPDIVANVQNICDDLANAAGFGIAEVALTGEQEITRDDILKTAGITEHTSLLFLDAAQTRARLLTNPWIAEATVLKLYPGRLRIEIKERKAFALWQKDAQNALIATDGTVLSQAIAPRFVNLPRVVGTGAETLSPEMLALVARYPDIADQVEASILIAERRWTLILKNGVSVLLPEGEPERALQILVKLEKEKKLLSRDIVLVDLRQADRVTVRLSDGAFAARDEALKARAKAQKAKSIKGTET